MANTGCGQGSLGHLQSAGPETVQVTQADRAAAAPFAAHIATGITPNYIPAPERVRRGMVDENPCVQAFARHRLAHSVSRDEVIEECARVLERMTGADDFVQAIRNLKEIEHD